MKSPFVFRAAIWIMWATWLLLLPVYLVVRLTGWLLRGLSDLLYDLPHDINNLWMGLQIKLAQTLKSMEESK